ncbi:MAG TPA: hypothetical protein VIJ92_13650 [Ginsengibacter sp.]
MNQHIKLLLMIKGLMKQKWKHYDNWPLVRRPDGGSHEWIASACER